MKKTLAAFLFLATTAAFAKTGVAPTNGITVKDQDHKGVPTFVTGTLGKLGAGKAAAAAKTFLKGQKELLQLTGSEDFDVLTSTTDQFGQTHTRMQEKMYGLPVVGAEYIIHSDAAGNVFAMNGRLTADRGDRYPTMDAFTALSNAATERGASNYRWESGAQLVWVVNEKSSAFLAWRATVSYKGADGPEVDVLYADASGDNAGELVLYQPKIQRAKNRKVYTANNRTTLPGTLLWQEGGTATSDTTAQAAYNYAGNVYDYYKNVFARDSYDGAGATIISSVHYSTSYNNAFWNGTQMVYGDGDGSQFGPLSKALDVDAHELTHAVTERTANLNYSNESGALNEATSDILGNSCEAYSTNGGTPNANTWKVGEDITTPGTAGDALRYMNNPTADGYSKDYYPERITGTADNGGVHGNSGIANLAYYLMVVGGTHPRGKTSISVTALSSTASTSLDMAQRIWYRALTTYWTSSTGFSGARTGTVQAATDLYGATAAATVTAAWDAVGAPGGGSTGTTTTLSNGVGITVSGATGSWTNYKITVPASQTSLVIALSGGTGDADLYVKRGAIPTSSVYDYRPYLSGNNETVTVSNPVAGDWYISLSGYSTYSGATLKATYSGGSTPTCTTTTGSFTATGQTAYVSSSTGFAANAGTQTGALTGPSGKDFDLYLQKLSGSTWTQVAASEGSTATENISYNGTAGTYRWRIYAYSGTGAWSLCTTKP
ncbi:MAG: M4 family metallopeptidase [Acidobacteria bacterium]|nr:M4 family metallopeptidase [Acidobacteriota bacterium]